MKIDEAVKLMGTGRICMCIDTSTPYRILDGTLQYKQSALDKWMDSCFPISILTSEWELVEEDKSLSSRAMYDTENVMITPDTTKKVTEYYYTEKDVKTFIQRIKSIQWFNDMPDDARHDIFVDIDKEAGPRFKVTK